MMLSKVLGTAAVAAMLLGVASCATVQGRDGAPANSAARRLPPRPLLNDPFEALENPVVGFTRRPFRS